MNQEGPKSCQRSTEPRTEEGSKQYLDGIFDQRYRVDRKEVGIDIVPTRSLAEKLQPFRYNDFGSCKAEEHTQNNADF